MNIKKQLANYAAKVDSQLEAFFADKAKKAKSIDSSSIEMIQLLRDYTMRGGKRIRPALIYYGFGCFKKPDKDVVSASMTLELVQSFLLIHDDLIDNDDLRRNGPTLHKSYEVIGKKYSKDPRHFGASMSICAGDICFAFANEILANTRFSDQIKVKALAFLNHMIHKVIYGQVLDILSTLRPVSSKDIEKIHYLKTATYTFEGPLMLGAILSGASESKMKYLAGYSVPVGKAFQLQDDILGMFGDQKKLGKPVGSDIREGKQTLLIIKALEKATASDKKFIKRNLGNNRISKKEISKFRSIIISTGSLKHSKKLIEKLIKKGKDSIKKSNLKQEGKQFLIDLADYMAQRDY